MRPSLKKALWFIGFFAVIAVLSATFVGHHAKEGFLAAVPGDNPDPTPVQTCANTACNTWCWSDGTHPNQGTFAKQTILTPEGCDGVGGCLTKPCQ